MWCIYKDSIYYVYNIKHKDDELYADIIGNKKIYVFIYKADLFDSCIDAIKVLKSNKLIYKEVYFTFDNNEILKGKIIKSENIYHDPLTRYTILCDNNEEYHNYTIMNIFNTKINALYNMKYNKLKILKEYCNYDYDDIVIIDNINEMIIEECNKQTKLAYELDE